VSRFRPLLFSVLLLCGLAPRPEARAEIPAARFSLERGTLKVEGSLLSLEGAGDSQEFAQGFRSEIRKLRQSNPALEVRIHWVDAVRESPDRGLASSDGVEDLSREIAAGDASIEVDGHRIAIPELKDPADELTPAQRRYVRNADRFAFIMRIGVIGSIECVHLFLTHHVPAWIPVGAGLATVSAMLFNVINTEKITNAINYSKWKSLTDQEIAEINERVSNMSGVQRVLRVPRIYFLAFLYEIAFQGSLQAVIHGLFMAGGANLPFYPDKFFGSIVAGSFGETAFDLAQAAYQETRGGKVPAPIRSANMKIISAVASILSVDGILLSSSAAEAGYWGLGSMIGTGLALTVYFRYTDRIHGFVLPPVTAARSRMASVVKDLGLVLERSRKSFCNALLRRPDGRSGGNQGGIY